MSDATRVLTLWFSLFSLTPLFIQNITRSLVKKDIPYEGINIYLYIYIVCGILLRLQNSIHFTVLYHIASQAAISQCDYLTINIAIATWRYVWPALWTLILCGSICIFSSYLHYFEFMSKYALNVSENWGRIRPYFSFRKQSSRVDTLE